MATPGPIKQKIKARITRTKAETKQVASDATTSVKKQVSGIRNVANAIRDNRKAKVEARKVGKTDNTLGYNVGEAFQTGKSKIFESGRPSVSAGSARLKSAKERKKGPIAYKDGQAYELSRNKRKAVRELISMRTDKGAEKSTPRELKRVARQDLRQIKSRPENMEQMRKQNKRKGRAASAAICKPGRGANLCKTNAKNEGGF